MNEPPKVPTQFSVGVLANLHDVAPSIVSPLIWQQFPVDERQLSVSKWGWIVESMALNYKFLKVKPAPTLKLNLSPNL